MKVFKHFWNVFPPAEHQESQRSHLILAEFWLDHFLHRLHMWKEQVFLKDQSTANNCYRSHASWRNRGTNGSRGKRQRIIKGTRSPHQKVDKKLLVGCDSHCLGSGDAGGILVWMEGGFIVRFRDYCCLWTYISHHWVLHHTMDHIADPYSNMVGRQATRAFAIPECLDITMEKIVVREKWWGHF